METQRVFVEVIGGVVDVVHVPTKTDGTSTVIDWDNIKASPGEEWARLDEHAREWLKSKCPEEYRLYFANRAKCQNCSADLLIDHLKPIENLTQRVAPGEIMPAGQCPDCGALCHLLVTHG